MATKAQTCAIACTIGGTCANRLSSPACQEFTLFMQNKPNLLDALMNVSSATTMNYEQLTMNYANKNKPKQSQYKANTNPIAERV